MPSVRVVGGFRIGGSASGCGFVCHEEQSCHRVGWTGIGLYVLWRGADGVLLHTERNEPRWPRSDRF